LRSVFDERDDVCRSAQGQPHWGDVGQPLRHASTVTLDDSEHRVRATREERREAILVLVVATYQMAILGRLAASLVSLTAVADPAGFSRDRPVQKASFP
jgi:hypothetical protein